MKPVTVDRFAGLRLLPEPGEARGALSMLNADIGRDMTQVGSRGGLSRLGTGTASYHRISPFSSTQLIVARQTGANLVAQLVTISSGAFSAASTAWGGATAYVTSMLGITGAAAIAARAGATNQELKGWDGTTFAGLGYNPRYVAVTPTDRRFVAAHYSSSTATPSGANGGTSIAFFSNAGNLAGTTASFTATSYVDLDTQDGEEITGVAVWGDLTFMVKRSSLYVFYYTSTTAAGTPEFLRRKVTLPCQARATTNRGGENMVVGADGVYLLLADGIYRATGTGSPQLVSRFISPLFDGSGDSTMLFPSSATDWTFGYHANRLYLSYQVGSDYRTLVYDTVLGEWLIWDISVGQAALPSNVVTWVDTNGLPTSYFAAGGRVYSFTQTATSDDGTAITSSYQSGFADFGSSEVKHLRQTRMWGTGAPTLQYGVDYGSVDTGAAVTLGTSPAVTVGYSQAARLGTLVSYKLSATTAWSVTRLTMDFEGDNRQVGAR